MMYRFSLTEADILAEALDTRIRLFPFQLPGSSALLDQRIRVAGQVTTALRERGLIRRGGLLPDIVRCFRLLSDYRVAIAVLGTVEHTRELYARLSGNRQEGVLAVKEGETMSLRLIPPEGLVRAAVGLLPSMAAGPGHSVTVTEQTPEQRQSEDDEDYVFFHQKPSPDASSRAGFRAAEEILRRPRLGAGYFVVSHRDRTGTETTAPGLNWIDTDAGRYLVRTGHRGDGAPLATYTPADDTRLARQLDELVSTTGII